MTEFNFTVADPSTLTSLTATGTIGGIKLLWTIPNDSEYLFTEIWVATSNDRSLAVLATTLQGSSYYYQTDTGNTRYFWIRTKNVYDRNNGPWEPVSDTAGVSAAVPEIIPTDIEYSINETVMNGGAFRQALDDGSTTSDASEARTTYISSAEGTSSGSISTGTSAASHEPGSTWDVWHTVGGSSEMSVGSTTKARFNVSLLLDWTSLSVTTGTLDVFVRIRLRNVTDSTDIDVYEFNPIAWKATDTVVRCQPALHWHTSTSSSITANKKVEVLVDVKKSRSDGGSTLTLYWERLTADLVFI